MSLKSLILRPLHRFVARLREPRMVYGWRTRDGQLLRNTRVSTHTRIENRGRLELGDHVFIGHFNLIDASCGLRIGEGCQITNFVSILSHSSHIAVRVCGAAYLGATDSPGLVKASTIIGPYAFIGPHSVIAPGSRLGKGVLVRAHSFVRGDVPDFAIVAGQPAVVVGDTRDLDAPVLAENPGWQAHYEAWASGPAVVQPVGGGPREAGHDEAPISVAGPTAPRA